MGANQAQTGSWPKEKMRSMLLAKFIEVMGPTVKVEMNSNFLEVGMDSMMSIEFLALIHRELQGLFPEEALTSLVSDYPSIEALADYLCGQIQQRKVPQAG